MDHTPLPLIVIVGPTAVGKTELSILLAEQLNAEIVSADSRLFYFGMNIGTAKPGLEERRGIPHHLIDVAWPNQNWSLALFQREARRIIQEIQARGCLPFLVGGTGQYVQAVIQEWQVPRAEPDQVLRARLQSWADEIGAAELHHKLSILDPAAAANIDARNVRRTIRALEVIFNTGKRFSEQRQQGKSPYSTLMIGLTRPRTELYRRIDERIENMISAGLVEEVWSLLEAGYSPDLPTLSAIGYREMSNYLSGKTSLEEAVMLMKRQTRVFVRRQANWFKLSDPNIHWFTADAGVLQQAEELIRSWLKSISCL